MNDGTVASAFNYGGQVADVTYGSLNSGGGLTYGYLETPTLTALRTTVKN